MAKTDARIATDPHSPARGMAWLGAFLRSLFVFLVLLAVKTVFLCLYRFDTGWVGEVPEDRWDHLRLAALIHHTSLLEIIYLAAVPNRVLWQLASQGVVPAADVTMDRPLVGPLYRSMANRVVSITRKRDETWDEVLRQVGPRALVLMAPEGRMMRADGLDKNGQPMTVRGGIGDILATLGSGRMILVYSGGLHHVQVPGQGWARPFRSVRLRFEALDLDTYRQQIRQRLAAEDGAVIDPAAFRRAVVADLTERRDRHCPFVPGTPRPGACCS